MPYGRLFERQVQLRWHETVMEWAELSLVWLSVQISARLSHKRKYWLFFQDQSVIELAAVGFTLVVSWCRSTRVRLVLCMVSTEIVRFSAVLESAGETLKERDGDTLVGVWSKCQLDLTGSGVWIDITISTSDTEYQREGRKVRKEEKYKRLQQQKRQQRKTGRGEGGIEI